MTFSDETIGNLRKLVCQNDRILSVLIIAILPESSLPECTLFN